MPITYTESALAAGDQLTNTWLNDICTTVETKLDHQVVAGDYAWPLILQGPLDFASYRIRGMTQLASIRFADQFASVQAAIDNLPAAGGMVLLGPRTYELASALKLQGSDATLRNSVALVGVGKASQLKPADAFTDTEVIRVATSTSNVATDHLIANLAIADNTNVSGAYDGISFIKSTGTSVWNVSITGVNRYGINADRASKFKIIGCTIDSPTRAGIYRQVDSAAAVGGLTNDIRNLVIRNTITGFAADAGIFMHPGQDSVIAANVLYDWSTAGVHGIHIKGQSGYNLHRLVIANNIVQKDPLTTTDNSDGIRVESGVALNDSARGICIANNLVSDLGRYGIHCLVATTSSTQSLRQFILHGNNIYNVGYHAIAIDGNARHFNITGNTLQDWSRLDTGLVSYGIWMKGYTGARIRLNTINGNAFIYTASHPNQPLYAILVAHTGSEYATWNVIQGNTMKGMSTSAAYPPIWIHTAPTDVPTWPGDNVVANNWFENSV